jgi:hypothetical protein
LHDAFKPSLGYNPFFYKWILLVQVASIPSRGAILLLLLLLPLLLVLLLSQESTAVAVQDDCKHRHMIKTPPWPQTQKTKPLATGKQSVKTIWNVAWNVEIEHGNARSFEWEREKAREKNKLWPQYLRLPHCPKGTPKNKTKNKKLRQYLLLLCSATISASANSAFVVLKILLLSTYIHKKPNMVCCMEIGLQISFLHSLCFCKFSTFVLSVMSSILVL